MGTVEEITFESCQANDTDSSLVAPLHVIPLHVRGGYVFPLQREDTNTERSRSNHWRILVALDNAESAQGELFVDDGVDIGTVESGKYLLVGNVTGDTSASDFMLSTSDCYT